MSRSRISMVVAAGALVLVGLLAAALFSPKDDTPAETTGKTDIDKMPSGLQPKADGPVADKPILPIRTDNTGNAAATAPATTPQGNAPERATTEPKPAPKAGPKVIDYTMKPGDMIGKLASRHGVRTSDIYALNPGMDDRTAAKIRAGTVIKLPTGPGATLEEEKPVAVENPKSTAGYFAAKVVRAKAGDNAASLAREHYGSMAVMADIARANSELGYGFKCKGGEEIVLPAWGTPPAGSKIENTGRAEPAKPTASNDSLIPRRR